MSRVAKMPVTIPAGVDVSVKDDQIAVKGAGGTLSLAQNVLVKVTSSDAKLNLVVGFSHPVNIAMPAGITVTTPTPTEVVVKGADRQRVGQIAAEIRAVRPPEPYKGKG